jgi:actin-like ATPase involved in cell morphogenesis
LTPSAGTIVELAKGTFSVGYSVGIDLGTTFTCVAVARDMQAEVVAMGNRAATIPTVVYLRDDGQLLVGDAAERRGAADPERFAQEFKRRFGDSAPIVLDRTPFSAERLMAAVLRSVLDDVIARQGTRPDRVGITYPANWGEFKLDLLRQAVEIAELPPAVFVTEPIAAAAQYASTGRVEPGDTFVVYDLGGGTFDAAVVRLAGGGFEILGRPQGIERLGGIDFDYAIFTHVRREIGEAIERLDPDDEASRTALARVRQECVLAKEALSSDAETTISIVLPSFQRQVRITRGEFEDAIRSSVTDTIESMNRAIASAGLSAGDLTAVLLAGGSSRIPLVAEMVRSEIGRPVVTDNHPKHAVACGAARIAGGSSVVVSIESSEHAQAAAFVAPVVAVTSVPVDSIRRPPVAARRRRRWLLPVALGTGLAIGGGAAFAMTRTHAESALPDTATTLELTTTPTTSPTTSPTTVPTTFLTTVPISVPTTVSTTAPPATTAATAPPTARPAGTTTPTVRSTTTSAKQSTTSAAPINTAVPVPGKSCTTTSLKPQQQPPPSTLPTNSKCLGISDAIWEGGTLVATLIGNGFDLMKADGQNWHVFWSSVPLAKISGSPDSGPFIALDVGSGGFQFKGFTTGNLTKFGWAPNADLCVALADGDNTLAPNPGKADGVTLFCLLNTPPPPTN